MAASVQHTQGTGLVYDERLARHFHAWNEDFTEKPERILEPFARCQALGLVNRCCRIQARPATESEILILHSRDHIRLLKETSSMSEEQLKNLSQMYDYIYFHNHIYKSAQLALGGAIDLVDHVVTGRLRNGMAIIRPPGHHAMKEEFNGYCYLNNVAVSAKLALDNHNLKRILIVDWDVHHGQGIQSFFYDDPRVIYFSIHRYEHGIEWPHLRESDYDCVGVGAGRGYNINVPLNQVGCDNSDYLSIFQQILLPVAYEFRPELVIVAAGYDSAIGCPEGEMKVTPACFAHFINLLSPIAAGKICLILEGGYCTESLSEGVALSLRALLGDPCPRIEKTHQPCLSVMETILNVLKVHRQYWPSLCYQGVLSLGEKPSIPSLLRLPPAPGMTLRTIGKKLGEMPLLQDCYDVTEHDMVKEALCQQIDDLIRSTDLHIPKHKVSLVYDGKMLLHHDTTSGGFEENPDRLIQICKNLKDQNLWDRCFHVQGRPATEEELKLVHREDMVKKVKKCQNMQEDTLAKFQTLFKSVYLCQGTYEAASYAVGSLLNIVDAVVTREAESGVAVIRPPGHHAESDSMMGFCIFNNVAIATKYAQKHHNIGRVLIIDWDVHHGNGTQSTFYTDPSVLYISLHRFESGCFYPNGGCGALNRVGYEEGTGYNVNVPWSGGVMGDGDYIAAFQQIILPIAYEFDPDLVLVSAGFDATCDDHMGGYRVSAPCFGHMTSMLKGLAGGRIVLALEGGYNLENTSEAFASCVAALLGDPCTQLPPLTPSSRGVECICEVLDTFVCCFRGVGCICEVLDTLVCCFRGVECICKVLDTLFCCFRGVECICKVLDTLVCCFRGVGCICKVLDTLVCCFRCVECNARCLTHLSVVSGAWSVYGRCLMHLFVVSGAWSVMQGA
ncbi:histone deacetylase 6-like isoform X2 [Haliotis rufescens]|uniref:histone deacetylase 6-like isoform X2 n=1 Tax=Haliotis rufescens TaxID=6454 RepID=UPI00201F1953|nr:histone deacetylase 6-like isoform X2 [Haliotis rufescens]